MRPPVPAAKGAAPGSSTGVPLFLPSFFPLLLLSLVAGNWIWMGKTMGDAVQGVAAGDSIYRAALGFPGRGMTVEGDFRRRGAHL
jgi:hypothetical protein